MPVKKSLTEQEIQSVVSSSLGSFIEKSTWSNQGKHLETVTDKNGKITRRWVSNDKNKTETKMNHKDESSEKKPSLKEAKERLYKLDSLRDKLKRSGGDYKQNDKEIEELESLISSYSRENQKQERMNSLRNHLEHYISHRNHTKDLSDKNKKPEVDWNTFVHKYLVGYSTGYDDFYADKGFDRALSDISNANDIPDDIKKMLSDAVNMYKKYYSEEQSKTEKAKNVSNEKQKYMKYSRGQLNNAYATADRKMYAAKKLMGSNPKGSEEYNNALDEYNKMSKRMKMIDEVIEELYIKKK